MHRHPNEAGEDGLEGNVDDVFGRSEESVGHAKGDDEIAEGCACESELRDQERSVGIHEETALVEELTLAVAKLMYRTVT